MITSIEPQSSQDDIEVILDQTEVDAVTDEDFGALCRLWYKTTLIGTFYRKIFTENDWSATPVNSVEPYHCSTEEDAKYCLVADYLHFLNPNSQYLTIVKNLVSASLVLVFLLHSSYATCTLYQNELKAETDCMYRGGSRREDCLQLGT
jgi:hypothetical protein